MQSPDESSAQQRLDQIATQWSLLRLAHRDASMESAEARRKLLLKYNRAIRDYVGALLQHESDADEVSQDILVRMLKGDFANADQEKGKFRNFLKVAVKNMVRTHWDRKVRREAMQTDLWGGRGGNESSSTAQLDLLAADRAGKQPRSSASDSAPIDTTWQTTVLNFAMRALENFQSQNRGCVYHTIMTLRSKYPDAESDELAERLHEATGKAWTAPAARQQLRRARLRFAQLLVEEVAASLKSPTPTDIEEELAELGLLEFVRPFLSDNWREMGQLRDESEL